MLAGTPDTGVIEARSAAGFKASYDSRGLPPAPQPTPGVDAMLRRLGAAGCTLSMTRPTSACCRRADPRAPGQGRYFAAVYALDLFEPRLPDKAAMMGA